MENGTCRRNRELPFGLGRRREFAKLRRRKSERCAPGTGQQQSEREGLPEGEQKARRCGSRCMPERAGSVLTPDPVLASPWWLKRTLVCTYVVVNGSVQSERSPTKLSLSPDSTPVAGAEAPRLRRSSQAEAQTALHSVFCR
ncbi:hypothetical protein GQ53DRAFT_513968 [Thozetella sp. PMI_491]|nr:hypothetical protein GQ53DRAFT_513968 [Thozetella sp. PMI_491]